MERLFKAGARGCDPLKHAAPRWSGYVLKLRRKGVRIDTIRERHEGPYPGNHARYVLRSRVRPAAPRKGA